MAIYILTITINIYLNILSIIIIVVIFIIDIVIVIVIVVILSLLLSLLLLLLMKIVWEKHGTFCFCRKSLESFFHSTICDKIKFATDVLYNLVWLLSLTAWHHPLWWGKCWVVYSCSAGWEWKLPYQHERRVNNFSSRALHTTVSVSVQNCALMTNKH